LLAANPQNGHDTPMEWVHPFFLWLFLLLPPLTWWYIKRPRPAVAVADMRLLLSSKKPRTWRVQFGPLLLRLLLLTSVIVALGRPRWPDETTRIPAMSTAIVLVLDVSGSMAEEDVLRQGKPFTRLEAAKEVIRQFVQGDGQELTGRREDLVGLVTFAARTEDVCPPTLGHKTLLRMVDQAKPIGQVQENTTNIGDALLVAIKLLQHAKPKAKTIILLSDGEHNVPPDVVPDAATPRQAAQLARPLGIRVHTIFLSGSTNIATPPTEQRQAAAALRDVAELTGGKAYQANDAEALRQIYAELDTQERTRIESHQYYRYVELYPWCSLFALACLILILVGEEWWWRKLP
jgi:Ca-activated chloride channel homolog